MSHDLETALDPVAGTLLVRAPLAGDRAAVWRALTTAQLGHWLGRPAGLPLRMGARFTLLHDATTTSSHRVTRWRPQRVLGFSWQFPDEDDSSVTCRLSAVAPDRTVLGVEHRGLSDVLGYGAGWQLHLDRLAALLAGEERDPVTFWAEHAARVEELRASAAVPSGPRPRSGPRPPCGSAAPASSSAPA